MKLLSLFLLAIVVYAQNPVTARYPTNVVTDVYLAVPKDGATTSLTAAINSSQTSFTVASGSVFYIYGFITIESEILQICNIVSTTITACSRGAQGTSAASHANGVAVRGLVIAAYVNNSNAEIKAVETALGASLANVFQISQTNAATGYNNFSAGSMRLAEKTVATLPSAATSTGKVFVVTDGTSASDCTVGGASTASLCRSNGSAWVSIGGGGGGGGSAGVPYCADATGSTTTYTCPVATDYTLATWARATFIPQTTNTTTTPTIAINGGLAKTFLNSDGTALVAGQLVGGKPYDIVYNGTNQLLLGEHLAAGPTSCLTVDRTTNPPTVDIVTACVPSKTGTNTWTGANDFSGASATSPSKSGVSASIPGTCSVGQTYFKTDAAAGQNLFGCTSVNTWTLLGAGTGGQTLTTGPGGYLWHVGAHYADNLVATGIAAPLYWPFLNEYSSRNVSSMTFNVTVLEAGKVFSAFWVTNAKALIANCTSTTGSLAATGYVTVTFSGPCVLTDPNPYLGLCTNSTTAQFQNVDFYAAGFSAAIANSVAAVIGTGANACTGAAPLLPPATAGTITGANTAYRPAVWARP